MKVVILAGGLGSRLSEETILKPKPMVEIGDKPILWHIMKIYSHYNFNEFIICLGYKGYLIKEYFSQYMMHQSDVTFDYTNNSENHIQIHSKNVEPWKITLINTGQYTMTGGRIKRIKKYVNNNTFMLTYGDGLADININSLIDAHCKNKKKVTVTAVRPSGRFGAMSINKKNEVHSFIEKPVGDGGWVNGGFFVLEPEIFNYIQSDETVWEQEPLEKLAFEKDIYAYKHSGYWRPMDTLRDKLILEKEWNSGKAKWKLW